MMSPRSYFVIFMATTRSLISSVFSIDCDGMMNICATNVFRRVATRRATMTMMTNSRTPSRTRRRGLRVSLRDADLAATRADLLGDSSTIGGSCTFPCSQNRQNSRFSLILAFLPRRLRR